MKRFLVITLTSIVFGVTTTAIYAKDTHQPNTEVQKSYAVKGEVVAIDKTAGKVKLKHEAVPELDWPAMTMFFAVANKSQLDTLNIGNQVKFELVKTNDGAALITQIKIVK